MNYFNFFFIIFLSFILISGCAKKKDTTTNNQIVIGLSMDTLKEERWQKDKELIEKFAEKYGAKLLVQTANSDDNKQIAQAENLISQGVKILLVIPHNSDAAAAIVNIAHRENIPVISYDRLIKNADVDLYISFDNERVGQLQAEYAMKFAPSGNYVYIGGAPTDNNASLFKKGAIDFLNPHIQNGKIKLVYEQMSKEWQPSEAQKHMENALTANQNNISAVICANDGTAGGAIAALMEQKLAGKIPVTGQDAEIAACQRIVEGKQCMTVYKPISPLAETAVKEAIRMAKKLKSEISTKVNNGKFDVPSILLTPVIVDKNNILETIIKDGFHSYEQIYINIPVNERPLKK